MIPGKQYTPEVLLDIAWRRKWLIAIPAVLIGIAATAAIRYLPNVYRSDTLILVVPQRVPESYVRSTVTMRIEDRLQAIAQQILSRTQLERVIQEFNLYADRRKTEIMEDIVARMRTDIAGPTIIKGDAFRIGFNASDPRTAMRVTERLGSLFIDESLRDREVLAEGTNQFLESQLMEARTKLLENEKKLEEYRRGHGGQLPAQLEANMQGVHNTEMQMQALVDSLNRDRDRRLILERISADATVSNETSGSAAISARLPETADTSAAATGAALPGLGPTPSTAGRGGAVPNAAQQLAIARATFTALSTRLKAEHPDILQLKNAITELEKSAEAEARADTVARAAVPAAARQLPPAEAARERRLQDAKTELESLDRQIAIKTADETRLRRVLSDYQKRIEAAPTREAELSELTRDYDTIQQTYRTLLTKKQDSQMAANLERRQIGEQFKILDPARLPEKPASPNRPLLYAIAMASAVGVGLLLAGTAEYFDRGLRSEEDIRIALSLPVLATIRLMRGQKQAARRRARLAVSFAAGVVVVASAVAVALRLLR